MSWVLFFDGECGFCSKSVKRVHRLDKSEKIDFAPLQGELSKSKDFTKYAEKGGGTMVFLNETDNEVFFKSDAIAQLGKTLGGIWAVLGRLILVLPKGVRDWGYDLVAKHRQLIAGSGNACEIPDERLQKRLRD